ncbi:hypothetical protein ABTD83_19480, partial [Acinetobacter baumannii]
PASPISAANQGARGARAPADAQSIRHRAGPSGPSCRRYRWTVTVPPAWQPAAARWQRQGRLPSPVARGDGWGAHGRAPSRPMTWEREARAQ